MTAPIEAASYPLARPRRLRRTAALRRLVTETRLHPADLVLPMFVRSPCANRSRYLACPESSSTPGTR